MRHWLSFLMVFSASILEVTAKTGLGIHKMLLAGTEILTVTGEPAPVVTNEDGSVVTTAPEIVWLPRSLWTLAITFSAVAPGREASRAPSRDALITSCFTITTRPTSIRPSVSKINSGLTMANSTAAAPSRLRRFRQRLFVVFTINPLFR